MSCLASRAAAQEPGQSGATPPAIVDKPLLPPTNDVPDDQPSAQHIWIPGHWRWGQGSYVWVAGRWELPPVSSASWVGPDWQPQGNGYVLRPGYWQETPRPAEGTGAAQVAEISTPQPPPPPRAEMIPEQPSPAYAWQPGYWDWRGNQFVWVNGRWELPPRQNLGWVPTHWETRGDRYVLTSGYWRENAIAAPVGYAAASQPPPVVVTQVPQPAQVVVTQAQPPPQVMVIAGPPPPPQEVVYARPSRYHVWVPGFWAWRGNRYVWIAGHWERPPHGRREWEQPRWERRGGNYLFIEGHWR